MGTKRTAGKMDRTSPQDQKIAVIWTRVSTKEQADNNLSLETQEKACRDYAERNGIEIDCIKGNTNESAKTEGKLFREMIAYVSLHKLVNTILVYSLDRFSRTGPEAMVTKEYLKSKGISIISVTQPIDNNNAVGAFMENIIFLFSQFENNLRKDKCTAGMIACLENGDWYSAPPIGYQIDKTATRKHQLVIDEKGPLIAKAFHMKADELLPETEICRRLRLDGWDVCKQRISQILHNPFYCGKIRHHLLGDRIVQGNHPAIVDEDTYNRTNGLVTHSGYTHADETPQTPLKRHVRCSVCGCYMTGYEVKKKHLWYYKCNTVGCRCNKSAKTMHERYYELLSQYQMPQECMDILADMLDAKLKDYFTQAEENLKALRSKRTVCDTQKKEVMTKFGLGVIPEDVYTVTRKNLDEQLDEIGAEIATLEKQSSNQVIDTRKTILISCQLADYWKDGTYETKQNIQNLAFPDGLHWDRESDNYRTITEKEALKLFRLFSNSYETAKAQKKDKSFDLSSVVAEGGLEPPTSGL